MTTQYFDFDAAWADEADEPVVLRVLGKEWACKRPSEVPAALLLKLDRLLLQVARMGATQEVDPDFEIDADLSPESILRQLAGDTNVDAWLTGVEQDDGTAKRLPYQRLMDVNRRLTAMYRGQDPEGEAPAANRQTRRAAAKRDSRSKRS